MFQKKLSGREEFCQNLGVLLGPYLECKHHFPYALAEKMVRAVILEYQVALL